MKNSIYIFLYILFYLNLSASAQFIKGKVIDGISKIPLESVLVFSQENMPSTFTNEKGLFSLKVSSLDTVTLYFRRVGYKTDTLKLNKNNFNAFHLLLLKTNQQLKTVEVNANELIGTIEKRNARITEVVTAKDLTKAPCCNLAESFQNSTAVEVNAADALSGAMRLQLLGLEGPYVSLTAENLPTMRGIASTFGLNYIPGPWLESVYISKGSAPVSNGFEGINGQINLEFLKPEKAKRKFLNIYADRMSRTELNAHWVHTKTAKWKGMTFFHVETTPLPWDMNQDKFLDMPLNRQINVYNRWKFNPSDKWMGQLGFRILSENRWGGQTQYQPKLDRGSNQVFGFEMLTSRAELNGKIARLNPLKPWKGFAYTINGSVHSIQSWVGLKRYNGNQLFQQQQMLYQNQINNSNHSYKVGLSFITDFYNETYNDSNYIRKEIVPGFFAEYTEKRKRTEWILSFRTDFHNLFGNFYLPKLFLKWDISNALTFRLNTGKSMRIANIIPENFGLLASSRRLVIIEKPLPESAWSTAISLLYSKKINEKPFSIHVDYSYISFMNQVLADLEQFNTIRIYNANGPSFAQSAQIEFKYEPIEALEIRFGAKTDQVKATYLEGLLQRPFVARYRTVTSLSYATPFEKWKFDLNWQWFGPKRLPNLSDNTALAHYHAWSPRYSLFNIQVTKKFKHLEWYVGGENIFNFHQHNPIIGVGNPFGPYFDAGMIWGPIFGGRWFTGIRLNIK